MSKWVVSKLKVFWKIGGVLGGLLLVLLNLPSQLNNFFVELPLLREDRLKTQQWAGMYSSSPEGIVNIEDLDLSEESDVVLNLTYSEEIGGLDGYFYSECLIGRGLFYPKLLLNVIPQIFFPNRLKLEVFDIVGGKSLDIDNLTVVRDGPGGIITVSSNGNLLDGTIRLAPDEHLTEEELDFSSALERARDKDLSWIKNCSKEPSNPKSR